MEINGKTSSKLKDRLARMFRRNSCNSSSATSVTLSSGNTSSRTLLSDISRNPLRSFSTLDHRKDHVGPTTSATTARVSVDCGICRPNRDNFVLPKSNMVQVQPLPLKNVARERRPRKNGVFYNSSAATGTVTGTNAGAGDGPTHARPPVSPSSQANQLRSNSYRIYYSLNKDGKTKIKKRLCNNGYGFSESSSSLESDGGYGLFSSDEEGGPNKAETETFFSSKSFSSDSSEFYSKPVQSYNLSKKRIKTKQRPSRRRVSSCNNCNIKEGFQPLVSAAAREKKAMTERVKKGFAVVKKSCDPYADFRNSMVEMITERQIFGEEDLEKLLHSYLSLNSPRHHPVILQAFSDIWVVLFGN